MTMLGKNLESLVKKCGGNFELGTSLKIAIQVDHGYNILLLVDR